jgi:hypothetical protein
MTTAEVISIILGVISIALAVGLSWYHIWQANKTRIRNEIFFVEQIQNNLKKMAQYFLDIEGETKYNEEYEENSQNMMNALDTFYLRHDQEMKDVVYQTKLYLPFWTELSPQDKTIVSKMLDVFSWLLYDYYPKSLPSESMRKITVINFRKTFSDKKEWMMTTTNELLNKYPANQI